MWYVKHCGHEEALFFCVFGTLPDNFDFGVWVCSNVTTGQQKCLLLAGLPAEVHVEVNWRLENCRRDRIEALALSMTGRIDFGCNNPGNR